MAVSANQTEKLFLRVQNPEQLEHGSLPSFAFSQNRATIGSGAADWRLYVADGSVHPLHAEIHWMDGQFTLVDLCGDTYINDHRDPLGKMHIVALRDADLIRIGAYRISVNIGEQGAVAAYKVNHLRELEVSRLFADRAQRDWMDAMPDTPARHAIKPVEGPEVLQQFLQNTGDPYRQNNPLYLLREKEPLIEREPDELERMVVPRLAALPERMTTAVEPDLMPAPVAMQAQARIQTTHLPFAGDKPKKPTGADVMMDNAYQNTDLPEQTESIQADHAVDHIVSAPLINSLGVRLEEMDTEQAHYFLHQSGAALQAAIRGLLALYQADKENKIDLALLGRSYQAIEDNPLRMGMDYAETVQAMFSPRKSRVHLSPEHAIEESMQNIRHSQLALIHAIQESLRQLLQAFAPEHLERRFAHYRHQQDADVTDDAWSWKMYTDYFAEMASSRQTGLEKMFWEIFEQSYDREMRKAEKVSVDV